MVSDDDAGIPADTVWILAWALGLAAAVSFVRMAFLLGADDPLDRELGIWLGVGVLASCQSAACVVVCAVKGAEARLRAAGSRPG